MELDLDIDQLTVPGVSPHAREELERAIERELDRLIASGGLPFGVDPANIDVGRLELQLAPRPTVAETGTQIARRIFGGLHQQATGRVPPELDGEIE